MNEGSLVGWKGGCGGGGGGDQVAEKYSPLYRTDLARELEKSQLPRAGVKVKGVWEMFTYDLQK